MDEVTQRLVKDGSIARSITVMTEVDGPHFLVKRVDGNVDRGGLSGGHALVSPDFAWRCFDTQAEAEEDAKAQYQASLREGFVPIP